MKTIDLELALMRYFRYTQNICVPNITPISNLVGFEVDLLILTQANFAYAVEIKVTNSDLKNDLEKSHIKSINNPYTKKSFEESFKGLKYFYYCIPARLYQTAIEQIPSFSGLLVARQYAKGSVINIDEFRKPTKIFNEKWSEDQKFDLLRLGNMRIFNLKNKLNPDKR